MTGPTRILLTPFEVIGCPKAAMRSPTKESIFSRGLDENVTRLRIGDIFFPTRLVEKVGRTGGGELSIYGKAITNGRMDSMGHYFSNFTVLGHLSKPTKYSSCPRDSGVLTWTEVDQGSKKQTRKKSLCIAS